MACVVRPRSTAFFATRPAPIITLGFDVFVQLVIAATTTEPCSRSALATRTCAGGSMTATADADDGGDALAFFSVIIDGSDVWKPAFALVNDTRS